MKLILIIFWIILQYLSWKVKKELFFSLTALMLIFPSCLKIEKGEVRSWAYCLGFMELLEKDV